MPSDSDEIEATGSKAEDVPSNDSNTHASATSQEQMTMPEGLISMPIQNIP